MSDLHEAYNAALAAQLKIGDEVIYTVAKKARAAKYECEYRGILVSLNKRARVLVTNKAGLQVFKDVDPRNLKKVTT